MNTALRAITLVRASVAASAPTLAADCTAYLRDLNWLDAN